MCSFWSETSRKAKTFSQFLVTPDADAWKTGRSTDISGGHLHSNPWAEGPFRKKEQGRGRGGGMDKLGCWSSLR